MVSAKSNRNGQILKQVAIATIADKISFSWLLLRERTLFRSGNLPVTITSRCASMQQIMPAAIAHAFLEQTHASV